MFHRPTGQQNESLMKENLQNEILRQRVRHLLQRLREREHRKMSEQGRSELRAQIWRSIYECFDFWEWEDPG